MYHLIIVKVSPKRNPDEELEEARYIEEISEKVRIEMAEDEETSGAHHKLLQGLLGLPWSEIGSTTSSAAAEAPLVEEILIPTASELHKAGVKFMVADHITTIRFELKTHSFYLP
ncbi:hypothetical protein PanWU01x14_121840 [Parasponia andersonii]|uniref:Uncharacterized protein n=1 Tax=Parasponia andersonii TaxID=3476 RepID=A0A2P5CUI6_PARAD|nr:hypothetical protein PanWU01x14_121840 [Parasponia andersonii]